MDFESCLNLSLLFKKKKNIMSYQDQDLDLDLDLDLTTTLCYSPLAMPVPASYPCLTSIHPLRRYNLY